jgi:hypothetical protein
MKEFKIGYWLGMVVLLVGTVLIYLGFWPVGAIFWFGGVFVQLFGFKYLNREMRNSMPRLVAILHLPQSQKELEEVARDSCNDPNCEVHGPGGALDELRVKRPKIPPHMIPKGRRNLN